MQYKIMIRKILYNNEKKYKLNVKEKNQQVRKFWNVNFVIITRMTTSISSEAFEKKQKAKE